jgi:3-oxoacyl-[acyl-carrier protein] reductase
MRENWLNEDHLLHDQTAQCSHLINGRREQESAPLPYTAGFGPAWAAVEAMLRLLAAELGPHGVRTVCLHSAGSEGAADKTLAHTNPELDKRAEGWGQRWMSRNLLGKGPTLEEVGNMAAFMASDLAGATTGTTVSLTVGMVNH